MLRLLLVLLRSSRKNHMLINALFYDVEVNHGDMLVHPMPTTEAKLAR